MDNFDELPYPLDTISCGQLTMGVFPMYIAIGQIFFNQTYYFVQNEYLKLYTKTFPSFLELYFAILELLDSKKESLKKLPFISLNTWQVINENDKFVCLIKSPKSYCIKFDYLEFQELAFSLKDIIFKPLCLSSLYSFALQQFAETYFETDMEKEMENIEKVDLLTCKTVQMRINEEFHEDQYLDKYYLMELVVRYKKIIKMFLEIEQYKKMVSRQSKEKQLLPGDDHVSQVTVNSLADSHASSPPSKPKKMKYTQSEITSNTSGLSYHLSKKGKN